MPESPRRVTVTRSGGVAGMSRSWTADATGPVAEALDACGSAPRPADADAGAARDAFHWTIRVDDDETSAPESALSGAWRELIEAVRANAQS